MILAASLSLAVAVIVVPSVQGWLRTRDASAEWVSTVCGTYNPSRGRARCVEEEAFQYDLAAGFAVPEGVTVGIAAYVLITGLVLSARALRRNPPRSA